MEFQNFEHEYPSNYTRSKIINLILNFPNSVSKSQIVNYLNKMVEEAIQKQEFYHRYILAWNFNKNIANDLATYSKPIALLKPDSIEVCNLDKNSRERFIRLGGEVIDEFKLKFEKSFIFENENLIRISVPDKELTHQKFKILASSDAVKLEINQLINKFKEGMD